MSRAYGIDRLGKRAAQVVVRQLFREAADRRPVLRPKSFRAVNRSAVKDKPRATVGEVHNLVHAEERARVCRMRKTDIVELRQCEQDRRQSEHAHRALALPYQDGADAKQREEIYEGL